MKKPLAHEGSPRRRWVSAAMEGAVATWRQVYARDAPRRSPLLLRHASRTPNGHDREAAARAVLTGWPVSADHDVRQTCHQVGRQWGVWPTCRGRGGPAQRGGYASRTATSRRDRVTRGDKRPVVDARLHCARSNFRYPCGAPERLHIENASLQKGNAEWPPIRPMWPKSVESDRSAVRGPTRA